ncbi:hypothetical protein ARZXY2_1591 [Arthrobacter sp. ZXY-2]|nr:hypothetical protein ARZXY2_1591 [Arthrobacter sp. ZXY-2]
MEMIPAASLERSRKLQSCSSREGLAQAQTRDNNSSYQLRKKLDTETEDSVIATNAAFGKVGNKLPVTW